MQDNEKRKRIAKRFMDDDRPCGVAKEGRAHILPETYKVVNVDKFSIEEKTLDDFSILTEHGRMDETLEYDLQSIVAYCKEKGIKTTDLSKSDIEQFKRA